MTVHTIHTQRNTARRLDRQRQREERDRAAVAAALKALEAGAVLQRTNRAHTVRWTCGGAALSPEAAVLVVNNPRVVGVGDGLFPGFSQTYRWCEH